MLPSSILERKFITPFPGLTRYWLLTFANYRANLHWLAGANCALDSGTLPSILDSNIYPQISHSPHLFYGYKLGKIFKNGPSKKKFEAI